MVVDARGADADYNKPVALLSETALAACPFAHEWPIVQMALG